MQNAQKEHKVNMDMLNNQLSHLASSMNEIGGNTGRLPATMHIPDKANVSKVTLWSGTSYKEPEWKESLGKSSETKDKGDILIEMSDLGWCDLSSSQKSKSTRVHQLAEKKVERKQGLERSSRRIFRCRIEKKKGPSKVSDLLEISNGKDKTPNDKKKSKAINAGQDDSGPTTKPGEDQKHVVTKSETPVVAGHLSPISIGQEGGSPTKPGENPTATFTQPAQEANIDNPLANPASQDGTPASETDVQEMQDKEGRYNQERKRKGNRTAK